MCQLLTKEGRSFRLSLMVRIYIWIPISMMSVKALLLVSGVFHLCMSDFPLPPLRLETGVYEKSHGMFQLRYVLAKFPQERPFRKKDFFFLTWKLLGFYLIPFSTRQVNFGKEQLFELRLGLFGMGWTEIIHFIFIINNQFILPKRILQCLM